MDVIDLHCHVLAGLDRGPADLPAAVAMLRALQADGVETVAATPYLHADACGFGAYELQSRTAELQHAADAAGLEVTLVAGAEVTLEWALAATPAALRHASLGGHGTDLLVEVPYGPLPEAFEHGIETLTDLGYRIVLAHPEVSCDLQREPERLAALVDAGVLLQVTARALFRGGGTTPSALLARDLVRAEIAHVLASDAHSAGAWRAPDLARGVREAAKLVGAARARWMVTEAPAAVLAGAPLPPAPRAVITSTEGVVWLEREPVRS